jgi:hypothetical protein
LLSNLGDAGCPICRESSGNNVRYFFWFFLGNYGSIETLDGLTRSLGFCAAHGAHAVIIPDGQSALAAVHDALARRIRPILARIASKQARGEDTGSILAVTDHCPACRNGADAVARNASFLAAGLETDAGMDLYGHPGVLCFPHLQTIAPRLSELILGRVLNLHEAAIASSTESLTKLHATASWVSSTAWNDPDGALMRALCLIADDDGRPDLYREGRTSVTSRIFRDPVGDFLESLSDDGSCPVCMEVRRAWDEWIGWNKDALARGWEATDVLPTCPEHVRAAIRLGDYSLASLTVRKALAAALYQCCLAIGALAPCQVPKGGRSLRRFARTILGSNPRKRDALHFIGRTTPCPVCNRLATARDRSLALLFALLESPQHRASFARGYGLCLKHFSRATELKPPPAAGTILAEVEAARLSCLQWELEESQRKDAWSNRPEAPGSEHTAWKRAVLRFSGSFG